MTLILEAGPFRAGFLFEYPEAEKVFRARYAPFIEMGGAPDIAVRIRSDRNFRPGYAEDLTWEENSGITEIRSAAMRFNLKSDGHEGILYIAEDQDQLVDSLENSLRVVLQYYCLRRGALMIHAAALGDPNGCLLLPATEGGGKSTIASMWQEGGGTVFGDDLVLAMPKRGKTIIYGLPLRGETAITVRPGMQSRLRRILFPLKGAGLKMVPLGPAEAAARLVSNIPFIRGISESLMLTVMEIIREIIMVPAGVFTYALEAGPVNRLRDFLHE